MRSATKKKVGVDEAYKDWIRSLPCVACFKQYFCPVWAIHELNPEGEVERSVQKSPTEAAHVGENRGLSQKAPDRTCIPLCGIAHHRLGPESSHVLQKAFWEHHGIDRDRLITALNETYERRNTL